MYLLLSIIFIIGGIFIAIFPQGWFELTQSWKSYSTPEPSNLYLILTRISGIVTALIGVAYIILAIAT